jgi:hypothetical protein
VYSCDKRKQNHQSSLAVSTIITSRFTTRYPEVLAVLSQGMAEMKMVPIMAPVSITQTVLIGVLLWMLFAAYDQRKKAVSKP